jgi:hypothetical protein
MDDAVGDGVDAAGLDVVEGGDGCGRPAVGDQMQLEARRARVDD